MKNKVILGLLVALNCLQLTASQDGNNVIGLALFTASALIFNSHTLKNIQKEAEKKVFDDLVPVSNEFKNDSNSMDNNSVEIRDQNENIIVNNHSDASGEREYWKNLRKSVQQKNLLKKNALALIHNNNNNNNNFNENIVVNNNNNNAHENNIVEVINPINKIMSRENSFECNNNNSQDNIFADNNDSNNVNFGSDDNL